MTLNEILSQLAAGDIDTDEAQRRIAALNEQPDEGDSSEAGDRAQRAGDSDSVQEEDQSHDGTARRFTTDDLLSSRPAFTSFLRDTFQRITTATEAAFADKGEDEPLITEKVERVIITAIGRRIRLVGDPSVAVAEIDGSGHTMKRIGNLLEIRVEGYLVPSADGFRLGNPPKSLEDLKNLDLGLGKTLKIRVNPAIITDVEVTAGSLTTKKLPRLGKVRVTAGGAAITGVVHIEDALIQAGNATISGAISEGRNKVRIESGNLSLVLSASSNVSVKAESSMGVISWPGDGQFDEYIIGQGSARLDVGVVMGHAAIRVAKDD